MGSYELFFFHIRRPFWFSFIVKGKMSSEQQEQQNINEGFIPDLDIMEHRFESKSSGLDSGADTLSNGSSSEYINEKLSSSSGSKSSSSTAAVVVEINKKSTKNQSHVAIIGSGDFGRALASRMVQRDIPVIIGSRNPNRNRTLVEKIGAKLVTTEEAIKSSNIIVMAVPKNFYERQPLHLLEGKTVIDVSNRNSVYRKDESISQAEYLQTLLPRSAVIKAFNVLSAYALESGGLQGSKEVLYSGDVHSAKEEVNGLIRSMGFVPVDRGSLRNARDIEDIPVQRFPLWKRPLIVSLTLFLIFLLLAFSKFQICWTWSWDAGKDWNNWHWGRFETIPTTTINSTLAVHALNLLALCYLPGCIAAWIQIFRGTKYSRFPNWLDTWLKMRKQLGLLMLLSASMHMCMSVALMSPTQYSLAYADPGGEKIEILADTLAPAAYWGAPREIVQNQTIEIFGSKKMHWRGECFLAAGVTAYFLAVLLGITSLPSVTNVLTWKEFGFVQSKLGWTCLFFACAHDMFYGWPYIGPGNESCYVPASFQYALYIPIITILLKLPFMWPSCLYGPMDLYLEKIREGWEGGIVALLRQKVASPRNRSEGEQADRRASQQIFTKSAVSSEASPAHHQPSLISTRKLTPVELA